MPRVQATYATTGYGVDPQTGALLSNEMGTGGGQAVYNYWTPSDAELSEIAKQAYPDEYQAIVDQYGSLPADQFEKIWTARARQMYQNQQVTDPATGMVSSQDPAWNQAAAPYEAQWRTTNNLAPANGLPGVARPVEDPTAFKSIMQPGVTIDPSAYGDTPLEAADQQSVRTYRDQLAGRDATRYNNDPLATQQAASGTVTYNPVDTEGAFRSTDRAINWARGATNDLTRSGREGLMGASELARLAAEGKAPSAAENMYLQAGADAAANYRRSALEAQQFARQKGGAIQAAQAALAAGQRGAVSGLAGLQAMNNTALGQAQVYQQAIDAQNRANIDATAAMTQAQYQAAANRATEMASARELYFQAEQALREGDIQAAQQLTQQAQIQEQKEAQQLQAAGLNATSDLEAQRFNVNSANTVNDANANREADLLKGNQATAANVSANDTSAALSAQTLAMDAGEKDRQARMALEDAWGVQVHQNADRASNTLTGQQTIGLERQRLDQQQEQYERDSGYRLAGAATSAAGTAIGEVKSDERSKHVDRQAAPPDFRKAAMADLAKRLTSQDFRRAQDSVYTYKGDKSGTKYTGPMAQQLPKNVQTRGPDGMRYVDTGRLAMNLASAVGRLQKKVGV